MHKVRTLKFCDFQTARPPLCAFKQYNGVIKTINVWSHTERSSEILILKILVSPKIRQIWICKI